ncbi:MAG: CPBP family intramembrane glutamic endopeptidase [Candidatus Acidiferrales bacterium]
MSPDIDATHLDAHAGETAPVLSSHSPIGNIFMGPHGIRAGWRLLLFLAFFLVISRCVTLIPPIHNYAKEQTRDRQTMTAPGLIALEGLEVVCLLVAASLMTLIEKKSFADYYLPLNQAFGKRFWQGVPYGFAMLSLLLALIAAFRGFSLEGWALAGTEALKYGAMYGAGFILVGIFEEFSFRGYMQSTLTSGIGFWWAAAILSILFGAGHLQNLGEAWFGALMAGSFGLLAAFSLQRTGNIWFPIGMHAAWDWGETYFYSVPDSGFLAKGHLMNSTFHGPTWLTGGTVGPEGSAFVFLVLVIGAVGIHFIFPAKRETV